MIAFARENIAHGSPITWWGNVRFEKSFTRDVADFLAYGGLIGVSAGLESATGNGLNAIHKGTDLESIVGACCAFKEAGVLVHAYMIYGYWWEKEQDLINSMETLRQFYAIVVQHMFYTRLVAGELFLDGLTDADDTTIVYVVSLPDIDRALDLVVLQGTSQLLRINLIRLHHFLVLCRGDISSMSNDAVDAILLQSIVRGKTCKARFIHRMVFAIGIMLPQKVKEHFGGGLLRMALQKARFRQYCYLPCCLVDINSYENLLSFERNFVPLHTGTVFNCESILFFALTKIQSNYYRTKFLCLFFFVKPLFTQREA
jgi:hypothetical protein